MARRPHAAALTPAAGPCEHQTTQRARDRHRYPRAHRPPAHLAVIRLRREALVVVDAPVLLAVPGAVVPVRLRPLSRADAHWLARQRGPRSAAMESAQGLLGATAWVSVRPKPRWGSRCDWRCAAPFHAFAALIRPGEVDAERLGVAVIRVLVRAFVNINANVHQGHIALLRTHHLEAWLAAGAVPAHASLVRTVLISAQYPSVPFRRPGRKACALSVCIQRQELQRRSRISGGGAVES